MKKSKLLLLMMLFMAAAFTFHSCQKETEEVPDAPKLPPEASFIMDFSDFESADTAKSFTYWHHAAVNAVFWNVVIFVNGVVPVTAFRESFNHAPVYQGDLTWMWAYSYPIGGKTYSAKLYGTLLTDVVNWEMYISEEGGYTDFKWYTGTTRTDETQADWVLYKSPLDPIQLVGIDYQKNEAEGTAKIQYTNIVPGGPENGGYIAYGTQVDDLYDTFYDIYNKGAENLTLIEWDKLTKAGRVQDEAKFGDAEWHCWDNNLLNTICP